MVAQVDKRLIWHPRGQNKFIVGGSTQITLYEWIPQSSEIKQVASQLELSQMKVSIPLFRSEVVTTYPSCNLVSALLGLQIQSWTTF